MDQARHTLAQFHLTQIATAIGDRNPRQVFVSLLFLRDNFTTFRITKKEISQLQKAARGIVIRGNLKQFSRIAIKVGSGTLTVLLVPGSSVAHHDSVYVTYEFTGSKEYEQLLTEYLAGIQNGIMQLIKPEPLWKQVIYGTVTYVTPLLIWLIMSGAAALIWKLSGRSTSDTLVAILLTTGIYLILLVRGVWKRFIVQPIQRWIMSRSIPPINLDS